MKILLTGANGFIGTKLISTLKAHGHSVVGTVRCLTKRPPNLDECYATGDLGPNVDWTAALAGCEAVIHLAARVHMMTDESSDPLAEYRLVNSATTTALAKAALAQGVSRFVFVSSIKVNGDATQPGIPYTEDSVPEPDDPYGISKLEAENSLRGLATDKGLPLVIVRPPLVYGPGVKANFLKMIQLVDRRYPVPLGAIHNSRSLIGLSNFCDLLRLCCEHPAATGELFLASDGEDVSTAELFKKVGCALGKGAILLPVPKCLLDLAGHLTRKQAILQRLLASLTVDSTKARKLLGWIPPLPMADELALTAQAYQKIKSRKGTT